MYELKYKAIALEAETRAFKQHERSELARLAKWKKRAILGRLKATLRGDPVSGPDPKTVSSAVQQGVRLHRIKCIRPEARCTLLAYGFLRGLPYKVIENFAYTQPNWDRVARLAVRYSEDTEQNVQQRFAQWQSEALGGVKSDWRKDIDAGSIKTTVDGWDGANKFNNVDWVNMQLKRNAADGVGLPAPKPPSVKWTPTMIAVARAIAV